MKNRGQTQTSEGVADDHRAIQKLIIHGHVESVLRDGQSAGRRDLRSDLHDSWVHKRHRLHRNDLWLGGGHWEREEDEKQGGRARNENVRERERGNFP